MGSFRTSHGLIKKKKKLEGGVQVKNIGFNSLTHPIKVGIWADPSGLEWTDLNF